MLTCYGDGSLTIFMRQNNGVWGEIWQGRPGGAIIASTQHNNGNDIATRGPAFSFPVSQWNGTTYVNANRSAPDSALSDARFIPNWTSYILCGSVGLTGFDLTRRARSYRDRTSR